MDILVGESGELGQTLIENDLVDQYNLLMFPVVLGSGKRLFRGDTLARLKRVEAKAYQSGVLRLIYQPERSA